MRLLLDTHALLWWLSDDRRPCQRDLISVVSLREIVVKPRIGKLDADIEEIPGEVEGQGLTLLGIAPGHLVALGTLARHADHRDPFDHLLAAQAMAEGVNFLSEDPNAVRYPVQVIACSNS